MRLTQSTNYKAQITNKDEGNVRLSHFGSDGSSTSIMNSTMKLNKKQLTISAYL